MNTDPQIVSPNSRLLVGDVSTTPFQAKRAGNATVMSFVLHIFFVLLGLLAITNPITPSAPDTPDRLPSEIIWLDTPGPGGGGGGGGNKSPDPPKTAELKGVEKVTVPITKPAAQLEQPKPEPEKPPVKLDIPAVSTATGVMEMPGVVSNLPSATASLGSGEGTGAGTGKGSGIGSGQGSGLGPGFGGGTGGGWYRPGNGVESPSLIHEVKPGYTSDAMRMKVQGVVEVEAIVLVDGTVGQVQVVRSLDDRWGLDQKALEAVKQWRFRPGTRFGKPVPVLVNIELTFTLR